MSNELTNKGIVSIGEAKVSGISKVVVVGTARGGTSLVAGVLSKLGVFMGDEVGHPVYEDMKLSRLFEGEDFDAAKKLNDEYTDKNLVWGWKRPSSINYLDTVDEILDKPSYIIIYKDLVSIAQRNAISMLDDVLAGMERANEQYFRSINFIKNNKSHALLVSFDKSVSNPEYFVDSVIAFCQLNPTADKRSDAIEFITPNPTDYLDQSRITKSQGRLGGYHQGVIFGWARFPHPNMKESAEVELFLNDKPLTVVTANLYRKDLDQQFGEDCYFSFNTPISETIKKGDTLRAKVVGDIHELENSPLKI
jgi:hypothetical protein